MNFLSISKDGPSQIKGTRANAYDLQLQRTLHQMYEPSTKQLMKNYIETPEELTQVLLKSLTIPVGNLRAVKGQTQIDFLTSLLKSNPKEVKLILQNIYHTLQQTYSSQLCKIIKLQENTLEYIAIESQYPFNENLIGRLLRYQFLHQLKGQSQTLIFFRFKLKKNFPQLQIQELSNTDKKYSAIKHTLKDASFQKLQHIEISVYGLNLKGKLDLEFQKQFLEQIYLQNRSKLLTLKLNLNGCKINPNFIDNLLCNTLLNGTSLKTLKLNLKNTGQFNLDQIIKNILAKIEILPLHQLQFLTLNFSGHYVSQPFLTLFEKILFENKKLKALKLTLNHCNINDSTFETLQGLLGSLIVNKIYLDISHNPILLQKQFPTSLVGQQILKRVNLIDLNLSNCPLFLNLERLIQILNQQSNQSYQYLREFSLNLQSIQLRALELTNLLPDFKNIRTLKLNFSNTRLTDTQCGSIIDQVTQHKNLLVLKLDLSSNMLGSKTVGHMINLFQLKQLVRLDLSANTQIEKIIARNILMLEFVVKFSLTNYFLTKTQQMYFCKKKIIIYCIHILRKTFKKFKINEIMLSGAKVKGKTHFLLELLQLINPPDKIVKQKKKPNKRPQKK